MLTILKRSLSVPKTEEEEQNTAKHFSDKMSLSLLELKKERAAKKKNKEKGRRQEGVWHDQWMCRNKDDDDKCGIPRRFISRPSSVSLVGCLSALWAM